MKKGRSAGSPMREYRRLQREIRAVFDPFTETHCATCLTPCCRKPSRVTPMDVVIASGVEGQFEHLGADPMEIALQHAGRRLSPSAIPLTLAEADADDGPCDFLNNYRCSFPDELRPFGCTTYICPPMYRDMPELTLRRLKRLVRELSDAHEDVLRSFRRAGKPPKPTFPQAGPFLPKREDKGASA